MTEAWARSSASIGDGVAKLPYRELAVVLAQVDAILMGRGVAATDCLEFECGNDLPSAIILLSLLVFGRNFKLLPGTGQDRQAAAPNGFCRYRLHGHGRPQAEGAEIPALPDVAIVCEENPCWEANLAPSAAFFLVPTSGSTGPARLVRHRHDRLLTAARHCAERLRLVPQDRVAIPVPIAHMFGLGAAFLPAVLIGAAIDLQPHANALRYLARERLFDPDVAFLNPSFGEALARLRKTPRPYRLTVMAGDLVTVDLFSRFERLHGCLVSLYGSSELGVIAAGDPLDPAALRRDFIGRLMPGAMVLPAPVPEAVGTLWFRHEQGFDHIASVDGQRLRDNEGRAASATCFRSNDAGVLVDGYLAVHGRADDLVNRDGLLVACAQVAAALRRITGIADAVVLGGAMSRRGRALIAFCVADPDTTCETKALRRACLELLQPRFIPDDFVFLPMLPRLPSGKHDRMALRRHPIFAQSDADADLR
jgi:acyl-coenzyme A synthetase/AMP-(fatty) acid ligase